MHFFLKVIFIPGADPTIFERGVGGRAVLHLPILDANSTHIVISDEDCWDFLSSSMAPLTVGNSIPSVLFPPNVIPALIEEIAKHACLGATSDQGNYHK